jgi:hypothetical protein
VVFCKLKASARPGPRARTVSPAPHGETYTYLVDKLWVVEEIVPDGNLVLRTRRGKRHIVAADDARMHPASWWERLRFWGRFPQIQHEGAAPSASGVAPRDRSS